MATQNNQSIYATGVYLAPMQCKDGLYRWVATSFEDDSFLDGDVFNPVVEGVMAQSLWVEEGEDDENPVEEMTYGAWRKKYQPELLEGGSGHVRFFDFPEDTARLEKTDIHRIWTLIEEDDRQVILPGARLVNRQGYYITEKPWTNRNLAIIWEAPSIIVPTDDRPDDTLS